MRVLCAHCDNSFVLPKVFTALTAAHRKGERGRTTKPQFHQDFTHESITSTTLLTGSDGTLLFMSRFLPFPFRKTSVAAPSARWDNQGLEVLQLVQRAGIHHGAPAASGLPPVCRVALIT